MWTVCWSRSSGKGGECYWELWRRDSSRQTPGKKGAPECPAREQEEREEDHPFQGQPLTPGTIEWNEKKWKKTRRGKNFWQYHCFTQTKTLSHAHTPIQTQTHAHTHTHTHAPHIYTQSKRRTHMMCPGATSSMEDSATTNSCMLFLRIKTAFIHRSSVQVFGNMSSGTAPSRVLKILLKSSLVSRLVSIKN